MNLKEDIKRYIHENLSKAVSPIFVERTFNVIDASSNDKEGLLKASERISNMIHLFIDKNMAKEMFENLRMIIEKNNK